MRDNPTCYELTLTSSYVSDWTFNDAIRELIQNGIDQEVIDSSNVFHMEYDEDSKILRMISPKSKLNINTLLLGKTTKSRNDDTIGQFGEGYKIAALVLNRLGKTFTIHNNLAKQLWTSRFKNSEKWKEKILTFYVSNIVPEETGLVIEVGNVEYDEYWDLEEVWLNFCGDYEDIEKIETSYGDILIDYEPGVYVSGLAIQYYGDLQYAYNFKPQYIKLERDRKTCDSWNAKVITSKMLAEAMISGDIEPEVITKMIEKDTDDIYQMDIIKENGGVKKALLKEFDKQNTRPFSIPVESQEQFKKVKALGGNPVIVKPRVARILSDETNERIEKLANAPMSTALNLHGKFMRWYVIYQDSLSRDAQKELEQLIAELE